MESSKRTTIVHLRGRLGNQLFQLATGIEISIAKRNNLVVEISEIENGQDYLRASKIFPIPTTIKSFVYFPYTINRCLNFLLRTKLNRNTNKAITVIQWIVNKLCRILIFINVGKKIKIETPDNLGQFKSTDLKKMNMLLNGYFQSDPDKEVVKNIANLVTSMAVEECVIRNDNVSKIKLHRKNSICLHVRRGDYLVNKQFGILTTSYFYKAINAIDKIIKLDKIFLYSDDPIDAIKMIPKEFRPMIIKRRNCSHGAICDLKEMTEHSNFVISNSSYSWWAAKLSSNDSPNVIAPVPWFKELESPYGIYPKNWLLIESIWD